MSEANKALVRRWFDEVGAKAASPRSRAPCEPWRRTRSRSRRARAGRVQDLSCGAAQRISRHHGSGRRHCCRGQHGRRPLERHGTHRGDGLGFAATGQAGAFQWDGVRSRRERTAGGRLERLRSTRDAPAARSCQPASSGLARPAAACAQTDPARLLTGSPVSCAAAAESVPSGAGFRTGCYSSMTGVVRLSSCCSNPGCSWQSRTHAFQRSSASSLSGGRTASARS